MMSLSVLPLHIALTPYIYIPGYIQGHRRGHWAMAPPWAAKALFVTVRCSPISNLLTGKMRHTNLWSIDGTGREVWMVHLLAVCIVLFMMLCCIVLCLHMVGSKCPRCCESMNLRTYPDPIRSNIQSKAMSRCEHRNGKKLLIWKTGNFCAFLALLTLPSHGLRYLEGYRKECASFPCFLHPYLFSACHRW